MRSIIIGGGKIGYNLLKTLKARGYNPTLVEVSSSICRRIAEESDSCVICGDGTELDVLRDAGILEVDVIAAVTGKDEDNLVICEIAKTIFNVNKTIARINNPKNIKMFKNLGVDQTVCSTEVIANLIEYEFDREICKVVQTINRGSMVLVEIKVKKNNPWAGRYIKELVLPAKCVIASIERDDDIIYPRGDSQILENDAILVITNTKTFVELRNQMQSGGSLNEK